MNAKGDEKIMETYESLREEFDRKVEELRERCAHPKVSDWTIEYWAIAHSTGYEVKLCEICGTTVNRRTVCLKCGNMLEEKDFVYGDGKGRAVNEVLCQACEDKWGEFKRRNLYKPRLIMVTHFTVDGKKFVQEEMLDERSHYMDVYDKFLRR